jgi:N utilization substance protein B
MPDKKIQPEGILRKSEARMAAVKAIYATHINSQIDEIPDPWAVTLGVLSTYNDEIEDHIFAARPDEKFLSKIIAGVFGNIEGIDAIIARNLGEGWSMDRLDHVMIALLRAAVFELSSLQKTPFKIIINEYLNISRAFFSDKETGFVNGILDKIAHEVRE